MQSMHHVSMDGQDVPVYEIHAIHPPGYSFYHYFDLKHTEVNGQQINPVWRHGVTLPNLFFIKDHTEEIIFSKDRTLHHAKEPFWFDLVHNYLHSPMGVSFYMDIFVMECSQARSIKARQYSHCMSLSRFVKRSVRKVMLELHLANSSSCGKINRVETIAHLVVKVY